MKGDIGSVVKMNPFRVDIAKSEWGSGAFEGEREIVEKHDDVADGMIYGMEGTNYWREIDLLFKGVDYT